jgi:chromosome partitioning protein
MPKVVTLVSNNPNVGKTTTLVNLAAWTALLGKKALLIDLDPEGGATLLLGIKPEKSVINLKNVSDEQFSLDSSITGTIIKDLFIVPFFQTEGGFNPDFYDIFTDNIYALRDAIDLMEKDFDYIFVDTPASGTSLSRSALVASDSVIIALKCEAIELETIPPLIEFIIEIKNEMNPWLDLEGILVTLYTESSLSRQIIMRAKEKFGDLIFKTVIPRNSMIAEANNLHCPVALHDIKSFGAESFLRLSKEFMQHHEIHV